MSDTITSALGLSDEWYEKNEKRIEKAIEDHSTISDVMIEAIETLKTEEFGDGNYVPTDYEKKLIFTGMSIANEMFSRKMSAARNVAIGSLMGSIFGDMFSGPKKEEEE